MPEIGEIGILYTNGESPPQEAGVNIFLPQGATNDEILDIAERLTESDYVIRVTGSSSATLEAVNMVGFIDVVPASPA